MYVCMYTCMNSVASERERWSFRCTLQVLLELREGGREE